MIIWIVVAVVILLLLWVIATYNGFVKLAVNCDEAFSTMDVYLKKRFDLIPNLVETVKGYAAHESETLRAVTDEKLENENILSGTLRSLFAVAESYPDLKANANFIELMDQLKAVENDIANSRKYYNAVVKKFNVKCRVFPSAIIAKTFGYEAKPMFEVSSEVERGNVKVDFGTSK